MTEIIDGEFLGIGDISPTALKVSYDELRRKVGRHLGFDRNPDNWEANQTQDVADIIKEGQGHFYWPPPIDQTPGARSHLWSFLCVSHQIVLASDTLSYDLPDDFVRVQSGFTFGSNGKHLRLAIVEDEALRSMQSRSYVSGIPRYVAIRSRDDRTDEGYELSVYPAPDRALTIECRYEKMPNEINASNQYHLGPAVHSKLLVSACLMEADRTLNPESISPDGGRNAQAFFQQLAASIAIDRQSPMAP